MKEKEIGKVSDYFAKVGVAAIKLTSGLKTGDKIQIKGYTTDSEQKVDSIQINKKNISKANKGDEIGIKVKSRVRKNDKVFLIE